MEQGAINIAIVAIEDQKLVWSRADMVLLEYSGRNVQVADRGYYAHSKDTNKAVGFYHDAFTDTDPRNFRWKWEWHI